LSTLHNNKIKYHKLFIKSRQAWEEEDGIEEGQVESRPAQGLDPRLALALLQEKEKV
jgi:hypothetical protein